jgi:hypothetical protein
MSEIRDAAYAEETNPDMTHPALMEMDQTMVADPMLRALRKALNRTRSDIASCDEHIAKWPTIGRASTEARRARYIEEEAVLLQSVTLRTVTLEVIERKVRE